MKNYYKKKINNQKIIALAQNNMLNYQAGFEDGKNRRTSAVQSIIENQQYYIFQFAFEKYERHIAKLQRENEELKAEIQEKEKLINALVDYIAKEDIDEEVCKHIKCVDNEEEKDCRECVKKFFESKIKESEN